MLHTKISSLSLSTLYKIFSIFGRRKRFIYAIRLIRFIEPLISRFSYYAMPSFALGTYTEYITAAVLNSMTHHNVEFDPVLTVHGANLIPSGGAIFITGHFSLGFVFMLWLYDIGRQPTVYLILGTDK